MHLLDAGDEVICCDDVYGGTSRLFRTIWARHGIQTRFADLTKPLSTIPGGKGRLVWVETPTNPLLKVIDIADIVSWARQQNPRPWVVVDNTFATPFFQRPLDLDVDIVLHSTTKYLNGHSDVVGGALVVRDTALRDRLHHIQNSMGAIAGPFDAWLVLRGIKTLALRLERHEKNALPVARFLERHPAVDHVVYPGLESHPQHATAKKQMLGFGGMVTFFMKGTLENARHFLENLRVFSLAESLGGVESLVDHPAIMTHASIPAETRKTLGITDTLVRLSVGIEYAQDLVEDLDQALKKSITAR
jgi:cystathionine gamma-lyase